MTYYVYMLKSINNNKSNKSYVGYTSNLSERINKHNSSKGAKSTRGYKWVLIYKRYFKDKSKAMSYEYKLKKDRKKRAILLDK
jgi:putative endonuclease